MRTSSKKSSNGNRQKKPRIGAASSGSAYKAGHLLSLKTIVEELYPLHRTLVSDGTDTALQIIGSYFPANGKFATETYAPGSPAWTWRIPERYVVHEAYLEIVGGRKVVDFKDNPLHLVSYSLPVDQVLTWEELAPHLHYSPRRPKAIPWEFKYYERGWGLCLPKTQFDALDRKARYHVVIRSEFISDPQRGLRVGTGVVRPAGDAEPFGEFLFCADVCHPYQANDSISGVAVALETARRLESNPLPAHSMSVRFLFCPETIGSIAYLSRHEDLIPVLRGGLYCEMCGHRNNLVLQRTLRDCHLLDRIARYVLKSTGKPFREGAFADVVLNDEFVMNCPGVEIPSISLSRWPYQEYHTSDDSPAIIHEDMLQETANVVERIVRIFASNFVPKSLVRGPIFLSRYGLWVDWRINKKLNAALDHILARLNGQCSVFDIAERTSLDYWEVREYIEQFIERGLVEARPLPARDVQGGAD
jgi:aminopeptidase-like protein